MGLKNCLVLKNWFIPKRSQSPDSLQTSVLPLLLPVCQWSGGNERLGVNILAVDFDFDVYVESSFLVFTPWRNLPVFASHSGIADFPDNRSCVNSKLR